MRDELVIPPLSALPKYSWERSQPSIFIAALARFESSGADLQIADGLVIRRITEADKDRLTEANGALFAFGDSWVIESKERAGNFNTIQQKARDRFTKVVTVLRLLQPGPVSLDKFVEFQPSVAGSLRNPWPLWFPAIWGTSPLALRGTYKFGEANADRLRGLYCGLVTKLDARADVALRRFDLAYQRDDAEDRLIDFWVALEALFSDGSGEITYKLAMRIAHFMEGPSAGRFYLYKCLKKAYEARSAVVHGGGTKIKVRVAGNLAGDALRACLRRLLLKGNLPKPADIDAIIARGN